MEEISIIKQIAEEVKYIFGDLVYEPAIPTDYDRQDYLFSEIDTLLMILNISQERHYKESFILIRTVFEKFLFFWLMFYGKKYRHPMSYNIQRKTSKTDREARDATMAEWKKFWKNGDSRLRDVISIQAGKNDNIMKVTYEIEGPKLRRNGILTEEIIPVYNAILEQYNADTAHIGKLPFFRYNTLMGGSSDKGIFLQKTIYNNFFYIDNILRNLRINNLVEERQVQIMKIHYNFLSKYVHVGKDSLKIRKDSGGSYYEQKGFEEEVYRKLIFLYVVKLFYLYLKVFITSYVDDKNKLRALKYIRIINQLESLSKDFWFFDNEPTEYDIKNSEYLKEIRRRMGKAVTDDIVYYDNPLERMKMLLNYRLQTQQS
jgi:hypothetical protein